MNGLLTAVPPWLVLTLAAAVVLATPRAIGHAVAALATGFVFVQALAVPDGTHLDVTFIGFDVVLLNVDQFSAMMGLVVGFLATAAVIYAYSSEAPRWLTAFALTYVASTVGTIYAGDWLTVIFFWELMAVTSTLLVWQYGGEAVRAGYRYAIFHGVGGTILLGAVVVHFANAGTFLFAESGIHASAAVLAAIGIGINCGFVFFHTWIPDTYPRPHIAASVFLSVFTTKTAVYVMYRAFPEGGWWLAYLGGFMAVYGVFFALLQYDPRRLLSYHIQAQVGYMLAGIGLATLGGEWGQFAVAGGFAHLFNNILYKSLLFMVVGVVVYRTGSNYIKEMGGLWKVMPLAFLVYLVGAASITAVPGFNGYISKGLVLDATEQISGNDPLLFGYDLLWWLLMIGAVGTFMSFIKLGYYIFFHGEAGREHRGLADARPLQTVGMGLAAVACVGLGVVWTAQAELLPFTDSVMALANPYSWYADPLQFGHIEKALVLMTAGFVGFFGLKRPLGWLAHRVRDVDVLINPGVFYLGRGAVWGVTEVWAAVDRFVMEAAGVTMWTATHPREALRRAGVDAEIRTGIGRSVLFLTIAAGAVLFVLLLG